MKKSKVVIFEETILTERQLIEDLKNYRHRKLGRLKKIFVKDDPPSLADRSKVNELPIKPAPFFVKEEGTGRYICII